MALDELVARCQEMRLVGQKYDQSYFEKLIYPSNDYKNLLQAFLFFNIKDYFPSCTEMLIYENPIDLSNQTNKGKCNFVYLTSDRNIFIIETKFINTTAPGETARKKRNKQRNKVEDQVTNYRSQISQEHDIPLDQIHCGVFTTDLQMDSRKSSANIVTKSISILELETWIKNPVTNRRRDNPNGRGQGAGGITIKDRIAQAMQIARTMQAARSSSERKYSDLAWDYAFECNFCVHSDVCREIRMCYFDTQGEGD